MNRDEQKLQESCVKWFRLAYSDQYHLLHLNHNNPKGPIDGARLKRMGMVSGVSDLEYVRDNKIHFIELKTLKGRQSKEQVIFENRVKREGAEYHLVKSFDEFQELITRLNA